jgi:DNA mismatch repair ATPase MutL
MRCAQVRFDHHCRNEAGDMSLAEFQEEMRIRKIAEEIQAFFDGCIPGYLDCTSCGRPRALHQEFPTANGSSPSVAPGNTSNKTQQSQTQQAPASVPTPAKSAAAKAKMMAEAKEQQKWAEAERRQAEEQQAKLAEQFKKAREEQQHKLREEAAYNTATTTNVNRTLRRTTR